MATGTHQNAIYQKFTVDVTASPDTTVFKIAGYMNELAEIRLVGITAPATPKVQIDGEGVTAVNSTGVSGWSQFIRRLAARCKVEYVRLATVFLNQLDMVPSLRPEGVTVKSFFIGYECHKCDRTRQMLMERGTHYGPGKRFTLPVVACEGCGQSMSAAVFDRDGDFGWM